MDNFQYIPLCNLDVFKIKLIWIPIFLLKLEMIQTGQWVSQESLSWGGEILTGYWEIWFSDGNTERILHHIKTTLSQWWTWFRGYLHKHSHLLRHFHWDCVSIQQPLYNKKFTNEIHCTICTRCRFSEVIRLMVVRRVFFKKNATLFCLYTVLFLSFQIWVGMYTFMCGWMNVKCLKSAWAVGENCES